jgi:uncharacterized RDD family membrane protein YckC
MAESEPEAPSAAQLEALFPRYAGPWQRLGAAGIDLSVLIVLETMAFWILGWKWLGEPAETAAWRLPLAVAVGLPAVYETLLTASSLQATLGKALAGLYVTGRHGERLSVARAALRHLARYVSAATLLVGFAMQPFTARKQALHDVIAGTLVRQR